MKRKYYIPEMRISLFECEAVTAAETVSAVDYVPALKKYENVRQVQMSQLKEITQFSF